jgi:hypothetical protein
MSTVKKKIFYSDISLAGNSLLDVRIDSKTSAERELIVLDASDSGRAIWDTTLEGLYVWQVDRWIRVGATVEQINNWNQAYDDSVIDFTISQGDVTTFTIQRRNSGVLTATYNSSYTHTQGTPETVWTISHNLNKRPSVSIVTSFGAAVVGEINYIDNNNLTITFADPFSGKAYLN